MRLHWRQILLYYGDDVARHESHLARAGQTTYGLLLCRWSPRGERRLASHQGVHAEQRLLQSPLWTRDIPAALDNRAPGRPIVVTLAINRSPCGECADALTAALHRLHRRFALMHERARFVLASRSLYEGAFLDAASGAVRRDRYTTDKSLDALMEAGWELGVLHFGESGDALPPRGQDLLAYLQGHPSNPPRVIRLGG